MFSADACKDIHDQDGVGIVIAKDVLHLLEHLGVRHDCFSIVCGNVSVLRSSAIKSAFAPVVEIENSAPITPRSCSVPTSSLNCC